MRTRYILRPTSKYMLRGKMHTRISKHMSTLALADMNEVELAEQSASIDYLRAQKSAGRYSLGETELWNALQAIFNRKQPIDYFVRGMDGSAGFGVQRFAACANTLEALTNRACIAGKRPDKAARIAMRRLLLNCLCAYLKLSGPLSPTRVLINIDKIEYATDQEYPGYIDAGILSFVLTPLPRSG